MSDEEIFEKLQSKDITPDLEIKTDGVAERVQGEGVEEGEGGGEGEEFEIPEEDHPLIEFMGMAIEYTDDHVNQLKAKGVEIPNVNKPLWERFGKPFLNKAFWYYLPDAEGSVDDPRVALLIGGTITAFAVAPSLVGIVRYYRKVDEEEKKKLSKEKPKTIKQEQKEQIREVAKEAEEVKQRQLEQAMRESPYLKRIKYEEFAGI